MKRNILILVDALVPGGAETLAVDSAIGLKNSGRYTPIVCATRRHGNILEGKLRENGVEFISLQRDWMFEIHKFSLLIKIIRERNIQIIHAHKRGSNFWGSVIGKFSGVPAIIAHVHGEVSNFRSRMINRVIADVADKVIAVSESERKSLIEQWNLPEAKVIKIYNGVNINGYMTKPNPVVRKELGLEEDYPIVAIVAGLRPEKNHRIFLLSASKLLNEFSNAQFLIVGDGAEKEKLKSFASELGISKNCIFTGYRRDISDILSIIDVGVLCSRREALPLISLEYMFSSKPVVATKVGGVPEVIRDGFNGFLVPPSDYNALAQKIGLLLKNKDLALEMGRNGLSFVRQNFTMEAMLKQFEDLYSHILETKLSRSPRI